MPSRIIRAAIAGILLIGAATGCSGSDGDSQASATSQQPAATAAYQTVPDECPEESKLAVDPIDERVNGKTGATFNGEACLANGDTVWALDYDVHGEAYYIAGAIVTDPGKSVWTWIDSPIGAPGETGMPYTITFVIATKEGAAALASTPPNEDGDRTLAKLPAGTTVAHEANIIVDHPEK